jgi:hypothetical protein
MLPGKLASPASKRAPRDHLKAGQPGQQTVRAKREDSARSKVMKKSEKRLGESNPDLALREARHTAPGTLPAQQHTGPGML